METFASNKKANKEMNRIYKEKLIHDLNTKECTIIESMKYHSSLRRKRSRDGRKRRSEAPSSTRKQEELSGEYARGEERETRGQL